LSIRFPSNLLVQPGDKEHITEPGVQNRCAGKEAISVCLVKRQKADLVADSVSGVAELVLRPTESVSRQ
jgi:hypothetical protein